MSRTPCPPRLAGSARALQGAVPAPLRAEVYVRHLQLGSFRSWERVDLALRPGPHGVRRPQRRGQDQPRRGGRLPGHDEQPPGVLRRAAGAARRRAGGGAGGAAPRATASCWSRSRSTPAGPTGCGSTGRRCRGRGSCSGLVRTVLFAPEDLALVRGDPTERRRFLDELLVTRTPRLAGVRVGLRPRAQAAQRPAQDRPAGPRQGDRDPRRLGRAPHRPGRAAARPPGCSWSPTSRPHMAQRLRRGRRRGRRRRRRSATPRPCRWPGTAPRWQPGATLPTAAELTAAMRERVAERRSDELDRGMTLVGPHRDDLVIHLGPAPAKGFASHGESWSLALALKLATFALLEGRGRGPHPDPGRRLRHPGRRAAGGAGRGGPLGRADADHRGGASTTCRPSCAAPASRSGGGIAVVVKDRDRAGEVERAVSEERPARPSDIARAALEAARAASAARPQPTRRRIAGPRRKWTGAGPGRRRPAAARPAGRLPGHRAGLVGAHPGRRRCSAAGTALVGPEIAAHCAPQTLTEGELLVVAESTAWATQLRLLAPTILGKLRAQVGGDVVTRLRVVGPTAPSWKKGPRTVRGRGPRDTYG